MSRYCDDCGTLKEGRICPNCQEELYINDYQMPEFYGTEHDFEPSDEWKEKVDEQRRKISNNL